MDYTAKKLYVNVYLTRDVGGGSPVAPAATGGEGGGDVAVLVDVDRLGARARRLPARRAARPQLGHRAGAHRLGHPLALQSDKRTGDT